MEAYRRQTVTSTPSTETTPPHPDNEIHLSQNGTITRYVDAGLRMLETAPHIVLVGKGATVNKTVTVAEIIKRRKEGQLYQYTQIGSVAATETWDPVKEALDTVVVKKQVPVLIVHLSLAAVPELETTCGFQAPTGNDIYL